MDTKTVVLIALSVFSLPGFADDDEIAKPTLKYLHSYSTRSINPDGTSSVLVDYAITALTENALEDMRKQSVSYSTSAERFQVVEAFTQKKAGKRIDIPPSNYQLEVNSGKDNKTPAFSDNTTMTVIFPDLAVGDTIHFKYKLDQIEALFAGQFSEMDEFSKSVIYEDLRVKFEIPDSMPFHYEIAGLKEKAIQQKNGHKFLEWTFQNKKPVNTKESPGAVYQFGREPSYIISTFPSYAAIAQAYGDRAKPKAQVTPRIQKLADELTKDKTDPYQQAKTLYEWVNKNISYAGNCIGIGSVVPRNTDFVLDNHMGDCKDHATLLEALLAAKKIASTQALINVGKVYELPNLPVVSIVNHVINYIPSLKVFADPTAEGIPFGLLPAGEEGKPVLLVDGYQDGLKTPNKSPDDRKMTMKAKVTIKEDGSASGEVEWISEGQQGLLLNSPKALEKWNEFNQDKKKTEEYSKKMIKKLGYSEGHVALRMEQPPKSPSIARNSIIFDVKGFLRPGAAGAFHITPLFSQSSISSSIRSGNMVEDISFDFTCSGARFIEEYVYEFPKNIKILAVPDNFSEKNELVSYQAEYTLNNNVLTVKRRYDDITPGPVCAPKVATIYKQLADKAIPDLDSQVVYK